MTQQTVIEKLLIVDDHPRMREWLRASLGDVARDIREAADGAAAVQAYAEHQPDCVVMDVEMKPMDGLTATRLIREQDPHARIIIVTSHATPTVRAAAQEAGAVHFLEKENLWQASRIIAGLGNKS